MKSTLLNIGDLYLDDVKKAPSVNKFIRYRNDFIKKKIQFEFATYDDVLLKRLPLVETKRLKIMLFFPFSYWNNDIERYDRDKRIYGDYNFGKDFKKFLLKVDEVLKKIYKNKKIEYVNPPKSCVLDRDKIATSKLLKRNRITIPKVHHVKNVDQLESVLDKVSALYVKPVFGAMGKGVSIVTKKKCVTNFIYRDSTIISRPYDYNWKFIRVPRKKRKRFLNLLIKNKFLFEEEIKMPVVRNRRFDIRAHIIYGKVVYLFARSVPSDYFITNWSQGGRMEGPRFLEKFIPREKLRKIEKAAKMAAAVTRLNYAGIDIIIDQDFKKIYVLEVHSFPAYVRRFNLMKSLADHIR